MKMQTTHTSKHMLPSSKTSVASLHGTDRCMLRNAALLRYIDVPRSTPSTNWANTNNPGTG